MRVQHRIVRDLLEARHADHAALAVFVLHASRELHDHFFDGRSLARLHCRGLLVGLADLGLHRIRIDRRIQRPRRIDVRRVDLDEVMRLAHEGRAAQIGNLIDLRARRHAMRDLDDLPLGVAVHQQIRLGVQQHRAPHLLAPVVEVRDATQRGLDAADDDGHVLECFARALRVNDHGSIRALAAHAARRVRIVTANALVRGVAVHHGIHVARGDAEEEIRPA